MCVASPSYLLDHENHVPIQIRYYPPTHPSPNEPLFTAREGKASLLLTPVPEWNLLRHVHNLPFFTHPFIVMLQVNLAVRLPNRQQATAVPLTKVRFLNLVIFCCHAQAISAHLNGKGLC